jgi:hypothetical protein
MKNVILLCNYSYLWELEQVIATFVDYCNQQHYHESLQNLIPEAMLMHMLKMGKSSTPVIVN